MKSKILIITILPLLLFGCQSSIWIFLTKKESKLYTAKERIILIDTTSAVNYDYGFDPDLLMDYLFIAGKFTDKEITARSPEMRKAMQKHNPADIISFYEKIIQLQQSQIWKAENLTKNKKWINATYIQKEFLPETELFLSMLEKNVIQMNPQYALNIEERKNTIRRNTIRRLNIEYDNQQYRKQRRESS
jgi:hypothetical protein